ncbi:MAG: carboxypeptidase regulatory-like domain-containing protein, partial [Pyrinomonadaceae bacterium]|nr:carboxypeptidase regulatory-like domain-containing protein [Pyrinomonadaceae bacterium]
PDAGNGATGLNRWMGAAAIDNSGNLAVGYSVSSTTAVPGIRYAGRSAAFTGGLNEGEATMFPGIGTQQASGNRWGDYTGLTVDPVDDCTFWYTNEYYPAGHTQFNWKTKVGTFTVAACSAPPQGMLMGTVTDCATGNPMGGVLVEVSGGPSSGFSSATLADGTYSMKLSPGNYTVTVSGRSCGLAGPFNVTVTDGGTTIRDACVTGGPRVAFVSAAVSGGNGNGLIDANECSMLNVTVSNPGCGPLTGASAVLSSSTPGVTVTQPNSPYPDIPVNGTGTNTVPFQINTAADFACGTNIDFTLTVTSPQGTFTINFSLPTCTIAGAGSITLSDPTQTGRLNRFAPASSCATSKANPGLFDAAVRHFDSYSFTNPSSATACATFRVTSGCGTNLFYATYLGSYNPANPAQNWLGDPGQSSAGTATWSVNVPAGQTVVLVIHEVAVPNVGCAAYSFSISGLPTDGGGPCPVPIVNAAGSTLVNESCPPANNAIDPGERVTVNFKLMNIGGASTSNLVATLQPTGGVVAPTGPQSYGAIPAGGMAGRDFSFTAAGNCGDIITATLQLQDGANNLGTRTYGFTLGTLTPPVTNTYSSGDIAVPVADFATVEIPITVADTGILSDVNARIRLNHTFDGDLTISLVHPDGTVVALSNGRGGAGDNFGTGPNSCSGVHTVFDDSAAVAIAAGTAPFAGSFRPDSPLSALNGKPSAGTWKLRFADGFAGDTGVVGCVQLELTTQQRVCTTNCSIVRLVVTSVLTRTDLTTVRADYTVQNIGTLPANNTILTIAKLGSTDGTPLPQPLGTIPPGGSASGGVNFTNSSPGAASTLTLGGTYTGGSFSSTKRVTVP